MLLERLQDDVTKKPFQKERVLFYGDNAPCHKSMKPMAKLHELGYKLLFCLQMSKDLTGKTFSTDGVLIVSKNFMTAVIVLSRSKAIE